MAVQSRVDQASFPNSFPTSNSNVKDIVSLVADSKAILSVGAGGLAE